MRPWKPVALCALISLLAPAAVAAQAPATPIAVFNFRLTTATPGWVWLEKYLSDQITTDFAGTPSLAVVARDQMQLLASQMQWVPEMAEDAGRMAAIRAKTRIQYLVSGLCSVTDERVEIIGQIIEVASRKELFRKTLTGPTKEVLNLQKRLSAELLGWFVKKPAAELLPTLPVWTRSIPAVEALYQGMDLYDHGRYADAWLKFRTSSHKDPDYVEALYWVGKMYYFMNRYEHARRSMERFVYTNAAHPRIGDAIKEYLDTYEMLDAPPEVLLQLYRTFFARWPDVKIPDLGLNVRWQTGGVWLRQRAGHVLRGLGRYAEGARIARPAFADGNPFSPVALENALCHNAVVGGTLPFEAWVDKPNLALSREFVRDFAPGQTETLSRTILNLMICKKGSAQEGLFPTETLGSGAQAIQCTTLVSPLGRIMVRIDGMDHQTWKALILAPAGQVFKQLAFFPAASEGTASLTVKLGYADAVDEWIGPAVTADFAQAARDGIRFTDLPRTGVLRADFEVNVPDVPDPKLIRIEGVRVVPQFEPLPPCGAIRVACAATPDFRVAVDGRAERAVNGVVGMLAAGRHTVRFSPLDPDSPFDDWETTVNVEAGKTTAVVGRLPWKKSSPWAGWDEARLIGAAYPGQRFTLAERDEPPHLLLLENEVRLVWVYQKDIWTSASADGREFSPPRRLDLPVSTAWTEREVRCIRDEAGRYVLIFNSDRDAQHREDLYYITWSRDFVHWTAPTVIDLKVFDRDAYEFIQDDRGQYLVLAWAYPGTEKPGREVAFKRPACFRFRLYASADGLRWQNKGVVFEIRDSLEVIPRCRFAQLPDGTYEVLPVISGAVRRSDPPNDVKTVLQFWHARSSDLANWTVQTRVGPIDGGAFADNAIDRDGRIEAVLSCASGSAGLTRASGGVRILWQDAAGRWMLSERFPGVAHRHQAAAYHPRWGYYLAYMTPQGHEWAPRPRSGPYLLHGPSLEPLLANSRPLGEVPVQSLLAPAPPPATRPRSAQ